MAINISDRKKTAFDIYKAGYSNKKNAEGILEIKQYYYDLRQAVIYELKTYGFCELLDLLLAPDQREIKDVDLAVFYDICFGYENGTLVDVFNEQRGSYMPYVRLSGGFSAYGRPIAWSEETHLLMYNNTIWNKLNEVRKMVRKDHVEFINSSHDCPEMEISDKKPKKESEKIIAEAKKQADSLVEKANEDVKKITTDASKEAADYIEEAKKEAKKITEDAKVNAIAQAEEDAKKSASKLIARYIEDEQKQYKNEIEEKMTCFSQEYFENAKRAESIHRDMCDRTIDFQGQLVHALDEASMHINSLKAEFYEHLRTWQKSLIHDSNEYKPLAQCFIDMYQMINIDKLLLQEVVFRNNVEKPVVDNNEDDAGNQSLSLEDICKDNEVSGKDDSKPLDSTILGLQKLNRNLSILLKKFEKSLNGLDLYVFYPKTGEKFDEVKHSLEDDDIEECTGRVITEYILPGVAIKKDTDIDGDDILIKALVKVATVN